MSKKKPVYIYFRADDDLDELVNNDHDIISAMTNEPTCKVRVFEYKGIATARTRHAVTIDNPQPTEEQLKEED